MNWWIFPPARLGMSFCIGLGWIFFEILITFKSWSTLYTNGKHFFSSIVFLSSDKKTFEDPFFFFWMPFKEWLEKNQQLKIFIERRSLESLERENSALCTLALKILNFTPGETTITISLQQVGFFCTKLEISTEMRNSIFFTRKWRTSLLKLIKWLKMLKICVKYRKYDDQSLFLIKIWFS